MPNDETDESNAEGKEANKALAPDGEPLSDYDKALALVERREKATEEERKVLEEKKKLAANQMLGGTSGGKVEVKTKEETNSEYRKRIEKEMAAGRTEFGN